MSNPNDDLIASAAQMNMDHVVDCIDMTEHDSLPNLIEQRSDTDPIDPNEIADQLDSDFERARQNLQDLAEEGAISLRELNQVARASQHPRAFEVVASMIDKLSKVNNEIVELHERREKAITQRKKNETGDTADTTVNQTYNDNRTVVKSTADLVREHKGKG